jgi:hypothetical protein
MSLTRHIEPEDLALFAMQLLGKDETRTVAAHVEECPDCRQQLADVQGDLAIYAHAVDMHSPPAQSRERLMKQVAREKKVVPIERPTPVEAAYAPRTEQVFRTGLGSGAYLPEEEPKRSTLRRLVPWAGWAVAAGLAVAAISFYSDRDALRGKLKSQASQMDRISADAAAARQMLDAMTDPSAKHVTLVKAPATATPPEPQGRATYVAEKGALIFLASNMEPLQPYKVYELWLIPADGRDPIPAGTLHPDERGNASVIMPPLPKGIEAKAFGVTVEDEGGSQTPTLPIILAGS